MPEHRITVLAENTARGRGILAEHGLAFWIELDRRAILFDTGQGMALENNARRLGIELHRAEAVALSHGHYDHTSGLERLADTASEIPIYTHSAALEPKYSGLPGGPTSDVGMPRPVVHWLRHEAALVEVEGPTEIAGGLHLTGPVPRVNDFEALPGTFFLDPSGTTPDRLIDDQAAFFDTSEGTVVVLGCAHSGVINTLRYVQTLTGNRPIDTVIGGMHLMGADEHRIEATVAELRRMDVRRLLPCHCTGLPATVRLWQGLPGRCVPCSVGTVVESGP